MFFFAVALALPPAYSTYAIVGSDYNYGTQLGISEILYKDISEQDPEYDYYSIKVMLADVMYQNSPLTSPLKATVRIAVPLCAGEPPGSHEPQVGFYSSQNTINFGFYGISFSMKIPARYVTYSTTTDYNFRYFDWTIDGSAYGFAWWFIFQDYADFSVGIRVPKGYQPDVWAGGWVAWYTFYGAVFTYHSQESYYWLHVTATEEQLSVPKQTPSIPIVPDTPLTLPIQEMSTTQSLEQTPSIPDIPEIPSTIPVHPNIYKWWK